MMSITAESTNLRTCSSSSKKVQCVNEDVESRRELGRLGLVADSPNGRGQEDLEHRGLLTLRGENEVDQGGTTERFM
jgi:hypothetical protein